METLTIASLAVQVRGVSYKPEDLHNSLDDSSIILLRANNIDDGRINFDDVVFVDKKKVSNEQLLRKGDILVCASSGSKNLVGKAASVDFEKEVTFGAFCKVVRPRNIEDAEYLAMFFQSPVYRRDITAAAIGANINNIRNENIDALSIKWPATVKRGEIVNVLCKVESIIRSRKQQLSALDNLIKARFVEMFGDPFSNPMNWERMSFKHSSLRLSDGPFGSNLKSEHYSESGVRVIRLGNIGVGRFIDEDKSFIPPEHYEKLKKYTCHAGEIVIGTLGDPNLRACIIPKELEIAVNKADCVHYIPNPSLLNVEFACQYINCPETLLLAQGMIHGQTRSRVSSGQIAEMPVFIPPLELQNDFSVFVHQIDKSKDAVKNSLAETQLLFDSLMQEYFG